jgi:hypothetical protein
MAAEWTTMSSVPVLKLGHWPDQPSEVQTLDLVGQRDQLRPESVLLFDGKSRNRCVLARRADCRR